MKSRADNSLPPLSTQFTRKGRASVPGVTIQLSDADGTFERRFVPDQAGSETPERGTSRTTTVETAMLIATAARIAV